MKNKRIGVLMGGWSSERDVSLRTGNGVLEALNGAGYTAVPVVLGPATIDEAVRDAEIDVAFLALHGKGGEDGCVQGALELFGIPYTGSNVLASALAMDKLKAKEMFRLHNVPTPPYYEITGKNLDELESLHGNFGFPVIVKPRSEGSSIGVTRANSLAELQEAIEKALRHDRAALVERFVTGREIHVGILDGEVLGSIEIVPKSGVYDYESKYTAGKTDYVAPQIREARRIGIERLAARAASALGCTGPARVDMIVTEGENEYVLEVNTLPGMTPTSLLPKIASGKDIGYLELCERILEGATLHSRIGQFGTVSVRSRRSSGIVLPESGVLEIGALEGDDVFEATGT